MCIILFVVDAFVTFKHFYLYSLENYEKQNKLEAWKSSMKCEVIAHERKGYFISFCFVFFLN